MNVFNKEKCLLRNTTTSTACNYIQTSTPSRQTWNQALILNGGGPQAWCNDYITQLIDSLMRSHFLGEIGRKFPPKCLSLDHWLKTYAIKSEQQAGNSIK